MSESRFRPDSLAAKFLELAQPDQDGFSRSVSTSEFKGKYERLRLGNGGSWCRDDSSLGRTYNIERKKEKGRIVAVRLHGFNKNPIEKAIRKDIAREIRKNKCAVLAVSNVQVDHRDGQRDANLDLRKQQIEDFQPLSQAANVAKRQHCKTCRETRNALMQNCSDTLYPRQKATATIVVAASAAIGMTLSNSIVWLARISRSVNNALAGNHPAI